MASLILRRSIYPAAAARSCWNWICAQPVSNVRRISSSPLPSAPAPWLMLEDGGFEDGLNNMLYNFYTLADKQVITVDKKRGKDGMVVGSSHGWLALMKWRWDLYKWRSMRKAYGLDMLLYNPLTHHHVNLPPLETLRIPKHLFDKGWGLPKKLILSCSPDEDEDQCRAVMFFGGQQRLAYCCPGRSKEWIPFGDLFHENDRINDMVRADKPPRHNPKQLYGLEYSNDRFPRIYTDIVYSRKKQSLFCRTLYGYFESWDLRDPRSPVMNWQLFDRDMVNGHDFIAHCNHCGRQSIHISLFVSLVFAERSDRLFAVLHQVKIHRSPKGRHDYSFPYQSVGFDVYEIIVADDGPAKKGELRYMSGNLDGMAFFIGSKGHGFVVDDNNNDGNVEPNSIYFTDPNQLTPLPWNKEVVACGGHDIGIFNYEKKTFSPCYYPRDLQSVRRMNPTPTWFKPSSSFPSYA